MKIRSQNKAKEFIRLWLDDMRDPNKNGHIGWTWVKTADEAISLLESGVVVQVSLDHDLDGEKTGYTVACWMEENDVWPHDGVSCHSMNPVGRARIESVIHKAIQNRKNK